MVVDVTGETTNFRLPIGHRDQAQQIVAGRDGLTALAVALRLEDAEAVAGPGAAGAHFTHGGAAEIGQPIVL